MRKARVYNLGVSCGYLEELVKGKKYRFAYLDEYAGIPISLTMPVSNKEYIYDEFPPFFDGLLPEGVMLEGLLRKAKLDKYDLFGQLMLVGGDMVGSVTVEEIYE